MTLTVLATIPQVEHDKSTCILSKVPQVEFNLVCGTASTVQPDLKEIKSQAHKSLMKWSSS